MKIVLPWPGRVLSPNGRAHWAEKMRAVKKARSDAYSLALAEGARPGMKPASIHMTFHPPSKTYPDDDNARTSVKAYRDGIADAFGATDADWRPSLSFGAPTKGGAVIFEVSMTSRIPAEEQPIPGAPSDPDPRGA